MHFRPVLISIACSLFGGPLAAQQPAAPVRPPPARTSLGLDVGYTSFSDSTAPWRLAAVSVQRKAAAGTLIARVTMAERFGSTGAQYELDAYPLLGVSTYGYLNAGYSSAAIFPTWRFGGELFADLPGAYEGSLGVRHLRFTGAPVTLVTGSVGRYTGNYWLSLRPYVRVLHGDVSSSAGLTVRRYYETTDDYVGARVGYGSTVSDRLDVTELQRQRSLSADLHGSRAVLEKLIGTWRLGVEREKLDATYSRNRLVVEVGARWDF